jgi:hypothetical protein
MASRGFEFAYMLDGTESTPVIRDFTLGETTAYKVGDIVAMQSDGYVDKLTASIGEVTGVMMEAQASASAGVTKAKVAIVTRNQVWRCSMDATTTSAVVAYTKTVDVADQNTIDADDITNGSLTLVDTGTDDEGNVLAYVVFSDTSFGNA